MTAFSTVELSAIRNDLAVLHKAASAIEDWDGKQARTFIDVGEYGLALDDISYAWLDSGKTIPPDMFEIFDKLATMMDLAQDAEFEGTARLRASTTKPSG